MGQTIIQRGAGDSGNALLDGSKHTDTVAQGVTRGSLIYANSTPKWDELVLGGARKAVMSDGTDALWRYPGAVYLSTATPVAAATVDFTLTGWTNGDFAAYLAVWTHVAPATDGAAWWLRTSTDGGSTFDAGASDYQWARWAYFAGGSGVVDDVADNEIELVDGGLAGVGNAANETTSGWALIADPSAAKYCEVVSSCTFRNSSGTFGGNLVAGQRLAAADVDALRFMFSSGNIASGELRLYGIPNA